MEIAKLIELDRLAREDGKKYSKKRYLFSRLSGVKGRHFIGIAGPRGTGKTVILKQFAIETPDSFYISLDTMREDLFESVKKLREELKINTFLIDEVHFNEHYGESLKKIYDFLDVRVIFTSSMSLSLFGSSYDLSRRAMITKLYPFSFREYLYFRYNAELPSVSMDDIIAKDLKREAFAYADKFEHYLKGGNFPFSLENPEPLILLKNIVQTVIKKDIPSVGKITLPEIDIIERLLSFIGKSGIDGINYSSISRNLGITKYKAEQYVSLLEQAFILLRVMPRGTNVLKEPKILMALPYRLLYADFEEARGALREDFFAEAMVSLGKEIYYLKSTRGGKTPDYMVCDDNKRLIIEIGGKGKGRGQFKGIDEKKKLILTPSVETTGIKRPLFLIGLI
jgi:predicted AAA+ superfamily ATPase